MSGFKIPMKYVASETFKKMVASWEKDRAAKAEMEAADKKAQENPGSGSTWEAQKDGITTA